MAASADPSWSKKWIKLQLLESVIMENQRTALIPTVASLRSHQWPSGTTPIVTVICTTFNHAKFIRSCIDSFLMQQTDFPVHLLIHDDASTDTTASILREYHEQFPNLFTLILQTENQHSKGSTILQKLIQCASGEFVALCEGDDYWTDSGKLAKQVAMMRSNVLLSLCGTMVRCVKVSECGNETEIPNMLGPWPPRAIFDIKDFVGGYPIHTSSALIRKSLYRFPASLCSAFNGDVCIFAVLADAGPVGFIHEYTSTYRIHAGGIYSGKSKLQRLRVFENTCDLLNQHFNNKYVSHLRRWEYLDACIVRNELWRDGHYADFLAHSVGMIPRYATHVTLFPWVKTLTEHLASRIKKYSIAFRMKLGLRTRFRRLTSR